MRVLGLRARRAPHAAAVVIVVLVLAGCGGSGSSGPPPAASSPAGARLIAAADEICERLNERIVATAPAKHATRLVLARTALAHATLEHATVLELSRLSVPAGLQQDWARILADRQTIAAQLVTAGHAWLANDEKALSKLVQAKLEAHNAMTLIARRDGFKACAQIGTVT